MVTKNSELAKKPVVEVISAVLCTFENQMGEYLAKAMTEGYELLSPPQFVRLGAPPGRNGHAPGIGFRNPFFLVLLIKQPK